MQKNIFINGFEIIEAVKSVDKELRYGRENTLDEFFKQINALKSNIDLYAGDSEFVYDFLGTVLNIILVVNPTNKMLTDRMYRYYMIHRFMELFGDHEAVSDKVYVTDKNVEQFVKENGERDIEKLVNVLSQAGETLSRNMRGKLNAVIRDHIAQLSSATIYFAVTNGVIRLDQDILLRLKTLCSTKIKRGRIDNTLFDPEYVVKKLSLYGYMNTTQVDFAMK